MTDETQSTLSAREMAAEYATGTVFDITECALEPIHLLGSVQSHGALLALAEPDLIITVASANTAALLGVAPEVLLGLPVADILGAEQAQQLRQAASDDDSAAAIVLVQLEQRKAGYQLEATVHRSDGLVICEFEPSADQPFRFSSFYPAARRALLQLEGTRTVTGLCQAAVRQVRAFTGYDRVVAYRFDGDGPGEVIAEDVAPGWEPWLGLWFPAIDVPPQARRLYLQNWIRVIADVNDRGAALIPPQRHGTQRPLDLSGSALRTVSSYHLEYLRNIGVHGSMSLSLIQDGRLWGLIACHSGTPRRLSADQRAACEMFGIALSLQLNAVEDRQRAAGEAEARRVLREMIDAAGAVGPERFGEHLVADARLCDLVRADGVYARFGAAWHASGLVPDLSGLPTLLTRLPSGPVGRAWSTHRLGEELGELAHLAGDCAGLLLVPLSSTGDVLAWFRGEVSRTVRWAADPERPVVTGSRGQRLTPRGSSYVWQETVRGQCLPWSGEERGIAEETYRALRDFAARHATTLRTAKTQLVRSDDELEAFTRAASHDLKQPLRGIVTYATLIERDSAALDDATVKHLDTIRRLASRMDELLNSLLEYSRLGLTDLRMTSVSMDDVLDDIEEILGARFADADVQLRRPMRLGAVSGDRIRLQEVLVNLVSNAIKYARADPPRWVEVGYEEALPPDAEQPLRAFYVRDNGIGIGAEQQEDIFRRVHTPSALGGGAGAGLTISRRIVERHGGQLWVRSAPGQGATFYFTL
ncbi:MAG TPA: ATP-binding protein [Mycobacterium sp.]|nr:ATP-binding protein [Mycobacterium sp.]